MPRVRRRFVEHHRAAVAKLVEAEGGDTPDEAAAGRIQAEAYELVKRALVEQYRRFERRNAEVLEKTGQVNLVRMRQDYVAWQTQEEQALFEANQVRPALRALPWCARSRRRRAFRSGGRSTG